METLDRLHRFPARAFLIGMALVVLALLSAAGGYSLRMLTATAGTTVIRVYEPAAVAGQSHTNPDSLDHVGAPSQLSQPRPNPDTLDHIGAPSGGAQLTEPRPNPDTLDHTSGASRP